MKQGDEKRSGLHRWITGALRASGEKELDRRSADDPFLRDALEGLRRFPEADHAQRLERLRQQLPGQNRRKRLIPVFWQRIAAAALLLLTVGSFWLLTRPNAVSDLSMEKTETTPPPAALDSPALPPEEPDAAGERTAQEMPTEPAAPPPEQELPARPAPPPPPPTQGTDETEDQAREQLAIIENAEPEADMEAAPLLPRSAIRPLVSGRVTDAQGLPVAGAEVTERRSRQSVLTNAEGGFTLPLNADSSQVELEIKHFNYANTIRPAPVPGTLNVELARRQNQRPPIQGDTTSTYQPYPEGGFPALLAYIENQEEKEEISRKRQPSNYSIQYFPTVTLAFTVYRDGSIGRIQVVGQTSAPDERVQALIDRLRKGPAWVLPTPADSVRTQITLQVK